MIIFEGSEEQFKQLFNEDYVLFTDEIVANFFDEKWGLVSSEYNSDYLVIDNYNLAAFADYDFMYKMIGRVCSLFYKYASKEIQNDLDIIKLSLQESGLIINADTTTKYAVPLEYMPTQYRDNEELVTLAMSNDPSALEFASYRLRNSREFVFKAMDINASQFMYASEKLRNDKYLVRYALNTNGWQFYAFYNEESQILFADKEHLSGHEVFDAASDNLKADRGFVCELLLVDGSVLNAASEELRHDRELILRAVSNSWRAFDFLESKCHDDKEIVLAAVKHHSYSLRIVSDRLKRDKDVVIAAMQKEPEVIEYISPELLDDEDVLNCHLQLWKKKCQDPQEKFFHIPIRYYSEPEDYKVCCIRTFGIDYSKQDLICILDGDRRDILKWG